MGKTACSLVRHRRFPLKPHFFEQILGNGVPISEPAPCQAPYPGREEGNDQILERRQFSEGLGHLKCPGYAEPGNAVRHPARNVLTRVQNFPRIRGHEPGDQVHQGGLSRAVRTYHTEKLSPVQTKLYVHNGLDPAEALAQALHLQQGDRCHRLSHGGIPPHRFVVGSRRRDSPAHRHYTPASRGAHSKKMEDRFRRC